MSPPLLQPQVCGGQDSPATTLGLLYQPRPSLIPAPGPSTQPTHSFSGAGPTPPAGRRRSDLRKTSTVLGTCSATSHLGAVCPAAGAQGLGVGRPPRPANQQPLRLSEEQCLCPRPGSGPNALTMLGVQQQGRGRSSSPGTKGGDEPQASRTPSLEGGAKTGQGRHQERSAGPPLVVSTPWSVGGPPVV